jgi:hypothetical protein
MMKPTPICEIMRRIRPLAKLHQAAYLRSVIGIEQSDANGKINIYKTSVRIRELQKALQDVQTLRLKREKAA